MGSDIETGTVKSWFDVKGFGFIVQQGAHSDIFVHHTSIVMRGRRSLVSGQRVRFRVERRDRGLTAVEVEVVGDPEARTCQACGQELPA